MFTWTNKNGGTCWMKNNNWKFQDGIQGAVCGYITGRISDNDRSEYTIVNYNKIIIKPTQTNFIIKRV